MARLPNPGSDDGTWGTILNDFLSQSLDGGGNLKSNVVSASQVADGALPQAKIQNLASDLANKVDTADTRLVTHYDAYPAQGYDFFAFSETPLMFAVDSPLNGGDMFFTRLWVPAGQAIAGAGTLVQTAGTSAGAGQSGFALYSDSGTLLTQTPANNNIWGSTGWASSAFSSTIAAQTSGRFVYVALFVHNYSAGPHFYFLNPSSGPNDPNLVTGGYGGLVHRRTFYNNGLSTFPAPITPATYGNNTGYLLLVGLA
jgi:hypothetical protein